MTPSGPSTPAAGASDYARVGGEAGVKAVVDAFVERMAGDMIIGFFFAGKDLARVKAHE